MGNDKWHVTAMFVGWVSAPDKGPWTRVDKRWVPHDGRRAAQSLVHAKTWGTEFTACGLRATSWEKLWDTAFPPDEGDVCPGCLHVVA